MNTFIPQYSLGNIAYSTALSVPTSPVGSWETFEHIGYNGDANSAYEIGVDTNGTVYGVLSASGCTLNGKVQQSGPSGPAWPATFTLVGCDSDPGVDLAQWMPTWPVSTATITGVLNVDTTQSPAVLNIWMLIQQPQSDGGNVALAYLSANQVP